ncbi:MAG TPA: C25 family cysteine peptidase, partial [Bacteroidales bacterium]|nr:C25 family cysteine peptidase [Bacteroidales bacterium]
MKKVFFILFMLLSGLTLVKSQPFGNEWIIYDQQYYAIKIHENGLYRISYSVLQNAGIPVGSIDPRGFQLFHRGIEQPIIVRNESSGIFAPGDYILFYAERNDGYLDQELYRGRLNHPNPDFSLFTDTTTYYLTWNNLLNNKRFVSETDVNFDGHTPAAFFLHTERINFTSHYYRGEPNAFGATDPEYTPSEGWFGAPLTLGRSISHTVSTLNPFSGGPLARVEIVLAGASNFAGANPDHNLQISFAGNLIDTVFEGYSLVRFTRQIPAAALNPAGTPFVFSSLNTLGSSVSRSAVAYIEVKYPHTWSLRNLGEMKLTLPPGQGSKTFVSFSQFNAAVVDTVWIFDLKNYRRIQVVRTGAQFNALVPFAHQERTLFLSSSARIRNIDRVNPVNADPAHFARFRNFAGSTFANPTFLLVTHRNLWSEATRYKDYRNTTGQRVLMVDVEELYHQFGLGISKHPLAIRNFVRYVMGINQASPPQYLFLLGKAIDARHTRRNVANHAA